MTTTTDDPAAPQGAPPALEALEVLAAAARAARARAYAPYSKFAVGAAVRDESGRVHAGCNVENAAYPQGWCAEASALAAMVLAGGRRVAAVAVCGDAPEPVTPCGGCRQKLREFADDGCPIAIVDAAGRLLALHTLGELLPAGFGPHHLPLVHSGAQPPESLHDSPHASPHDSPPPSPSQPPAR